MAKDKAINNFTYDRESHTRKSQREVKGGLSRREQHQLRMLGRNDKEDEKC